MSGIDDLKNKAQNLVREHEDQIKKGIDKAAGLADSKTKGKHSDKVDQGADKAKGMIDRLKK